MVHVGTNDYFVLLGTKEEDLKKEQSLLTPDEIVNFLLAKFEEGLPEAKRDYKGAVLRDKPKAFLDYIVQMDALSTLRRSSKWPEKKRARYAHKCLKGFNDDLKIYLVRYQGELILATHSMFINLHGLFKY